MKRATIFLFAVMAILLTSCSTLETITRAVNETGRTIKEVRGVVEDLRKDYVTAKAAADADGDGDTSGSEWLAWLLGGGAGTILAAVAEARRRVSIRNTESDARKSAAEARIAALEARA